MTFVQSWRNAVDGTSQTVTVSGATAGSLLVACMAHRSNGSMTAVSTSGDLWTAVETAEFATSSVSGATFYRIASGTTDDNFVASWTGNNNTELLVAEYSGLDAISPFEDSSEDVTNVADSHTTCGTGTATPVTANGLAIATLSGWTETLWEVETTTITNSFVEDVNGSVGGSKPLCAFASKAYTSIAGQVAEWQTTDSGTAVWGTMMVFKEPAAGGPTGTATQTLPSLSQSGSGTHTSTAASGTGTQSLPVLVQVGTGAQELPGSAAQTLPSLVQSGTATHTENAAGSAAQTLPALTQAATAASDAVPDVTIGVEFDGTQRIYKTDLTWQATAVDLTMSVWFMRDGNPAATEMICRHFASQTLEDSVTEASLNTSGDLTLRIKGTHISGENIFSHTFSSVCDGAWHHAMLTWDAGGNSWVALDGVRTTKTNSNIGPYQLQGTDDDTNDSISVGASNSAGTSPFSGCVGEVWLEDVAYSDSDASVQKFRNTDGSAVDLGILGDGPGQQPHYYLSGGQAQAEANWGSGDFPYTVVGTLLDCNIFLTHTATGAQTLPSLTQSASGLQTETATGSAAQTLPSLAQAGTGNLISPVTSTGAQTLSALVQAATALAANPVTATGAQTLPNLVQVGTGAHSAPPAPEITVPFSTWDPLAHLPAGQILTRETHKALMEAWIAGDYAEMTDAAIEAIVGDPLDTPSLKREFLTGQYPTSRTRTVDRRERGIRK